MVAIVRSSSSFSLASVTETLSLIVTLRKVSARATYSQLLLLRVPVEM